MKNKKNSYESEATNALVEELTKMTTTIYERVIPTPFNFVYTNEFRENNPEEFQNNHYVDIRKHYNVIKEHGKNYIMENFMIKYHLKIIQKLYIILLILKM